MNCKVTSEELEVLMPHFNNNGFVDGCEFILLFYQLRFEHRSKLWTDRINKDKRTKLLKKTISQKKDEDREHKVQIILTNDYSADDLQSALSKIVDAAVKYDRLMPGAVQLDAFECEYMVPNVFR